MRRSSFTADLLREGAVPEREYHYYMSLCQFNCGELTEAKRHISAVLRLQPANTQAQALLQRIDHQMQTGLRSVLTTARDSCGPRWAEGHCARRQCCTHRWCARGLCAAQVD